MRTAQYARLLKSAEDQIMNDAFGASADGTGLSQAEPKVSALRASIPDADAFIRSALITEIDRMMEELGMPPLLERTYPNGWRHHARAGLISLYELCRRTFIQREKDNA